MTSTHVRSFAMTFALAIAGGASIALAQVSDTNGVAAARSLYAAASYEEALVLLSTLSSTPGQHDVDQYRALCLLALNRESEAAQALEAIVTSSPLYQMTDTDVSPRLVTLFKDVRRRILPPRARQLYAEAKADFEAARYSEASSLLRTLLGILDDRDLDAGTELADLRLVADGFLRLSDIASRAATRAVDPPSVVAAAPAPAAKVEPVVAAPPVFSARDRAVVAPVPISRKLPLWSPPNQLMRTVEFRGELAIVVNERGGVDSAVVRVPVSPFYDPDLLKAAKQWTFRPAMKDGVPVKYQTIIPVVLRP